MTHESAERLLYCANRAGKSYAAMIAQQEAQSRLIAGEVFKRSAMSLYYARMLEALGESADDNR